MRGDSDILNRHIYYERGQWHFKPPYLLRKDSAIVNQFTQVSPAIVNHFTQASPVAYTSSQKTKLTAMKLLQNTRFTALAMLTCQFK